MKTASFDVHNSSNETSKEQLEHQLKLKMRHCDIDFLFRIKIEYWKNIKYSVFFPHQKLIFSGFPLTRSKKHIK